MIATKKLELNGNKQDTVLEELPTQYAQENNRSYFQSSLVELGDVKDEFIQELKDEYGKDCNFWTFTKNHLSRDKGHHLKLHSYVLPPGLI